MSDFDRDFAPPPGSGSFWGSAREDAKEQKPEKAAAPAAHDFSDFEAGEKSFDDFTAEDFAPPEPEAPEQGESKMPPPFSLDGLDLLTPPGFVGDVAAWIDSQCRYPRRRLAVASAIATVGNIGGMTHDDIKDGVTANMLVFCVAASATGKEAVQQAMGDLHRAAGMQSALQGGIKSEQEILRNLIEHQAAFYVIDEIGIFLSKVRNAQKRGGASYLEGVFALIMSAYSKANSRLLLQGDLKRELRKTFSKSKKGDFDGDDDEEVNPQSARMLNMIEDGLDRPFLSMVGYTTPSTFDGVMDGEAATQGFIGRSIIITEKDINPYSRENFRKGDVPRNIAMRLSQLYRGSSFDMMASDTNRVEFCGDRIAVPTDEDAAEMLIKVSRWLLAYADEMGEQTGEASVAMIRRAYEMVAKVSFILAMPGRRRTAEHVRWAFAYIRQEVDAKIALVFANENGKHRPEESQSARLLSYMDPDKGSSVSVLANRARITEDEARSLLVRMEHAGQVISGTGKRKYKGKPVMVWRPVEH